MTKGFSQAKVAQQEYVESGRWKCDKSPSGAHFWIIEDNNESMECKHCHEVKQVIHRKDWRATAGYGKSTEGEKNKNNRKRWND